MSPWKTKELIDYFSPGGGCRHGGNTVVIREPRIRYRSGEGKSSRVDVIHVREKWERTARKTGHGLAPH